MSKVQYEVFQRTPHFEQAAAPMRMRPLDWELLFALDGRARLGDLARQLLVDVEEAVDAVVVCERLGLVERRRISLAEGRAEFDIPRASPQEPAFLMEPNEFVVSVPVADEQPAPERPPFISTEPVPAPGHEAHPLAGAAGKPIEFKLTPTVQVLIR